MITGRNTPVDRCHRRPTVIQLAVVALVTMLITRTAAANPQSHASIREAVRAAVANFVAIQQLDDAEITVGRLDSRLSLTACGTPLDVFAPPGGRLLGNTSMGVRCHQPQPWTLYVPVAVNAYQNAISTARPLSKGAILTSADITITRQSVNRLPNGAVSDPNQILGQLMARPVAGGTVLTTSMVAPPKVVRRGQTVTLFAKHAGIEVRGTGKALVDGATGDRVSVENTTSKRVVDGVVLANGTVEVAM